MLPSNVDDEVRSAWSRFQACLLALLPVIHTLLPHVEVIEVWMKNCPSLNPLSRFTVFENHSKKSHFTTLRIKHLQCPKYLNFRAKNIISVNILNWGKYKFFEWFSNTVNLDNGFKEGQLFIQTSIFFFSCSKIEIIIFFFLISFSFFVQKLKIFLKRFF